MHDAHRPVDPGLVCSDFSDSALSISTGIHRAASKDDRHAAESETGWPADRSADPGSETRKANASRDHHSARQHTVVRRSWAHVSLWDSKQMVHMNFRIGKIFFVGFFRFILQSKEEINNQLTDKQKTADEKIKELEVWVHEMRCIWWSRLYECALIMLCNLQQKKVYLERSVKEAEDNIREMLLSRRAQWWSHKRRIHHPI